MEFREFLSFAESFNIRIVARIVEHFDLIEIF